MTYIYPGTNDYVSRYVTGHIINYETEHNYRTLCDKYFSKDRDDLTTRDRAEPGVSLCKKCKQIRAERNRKRPAPKVVGEEDLRRWNEMIK